MGTSGPCTGWAFNKGLPFHEAWALCLACLLRHQGPRAEGLHPRAQPLGLLFPWGSGSASPLSGVNDPWQPVDPPRIPFRGWRVDEGSRDEGATGGGLPAVPPGLPHTTVQLPWRLVPLHPEDPFVSIPHLTAAQRGWWQHCWQAARALQQSH